MRVVFRYENIWKFLIIAYNPLLSSFPPKFGNAAGTHYWGDYDLQMKSRLIEILIETRRRKNDLCCERSASEGAALLRDEWRTRRVR